jgi:hypothetical protein
MKKWQWMGGIGVIRKGISVRFEWYKIEGSNDYGVRNFFFWLKSKKINKKKKKKTAHFSQPPATRHSHSHTTYPVPKWPHKSPLSNEPTATHPLPPVHPPREHFHEVRRPQLPPPALDARRHVQVAQRNRRQKVHLEQAVCAMYSRK